MLNGNTTFHLGIDDTDSLTGGCTTHLAVKLIRELVTKHNIRLLDFPYLVRLNPNVPFRTRGNGAIAIHFYCDSISSDALLSELWPIILAYTSERSTEANPALICFKGKIPEELNKLYCRALTSVIPLEDVRKLILSRKFQWREKGTGRGLVGATSALGAALLRNDHTFELITYRENTSKKTRAYDAIEVWKLAERYKTVSFSNVDPETSSVLLFPRGYDPVYAGIRGDAVNDLISFWNDLGAKERIQEAMVFRTNQGTDAHLRSVTPINGLEDHSSTIICGEVSSSPRFSGTHAHFTVQDETGSIECYIYEPAKKFRHIAMKARIGDKILISGGVRPASPELDLPRALNVEKIVFQELITIFREFNPPCPVCGKAVTSKGQGQGYFCKKCKIKYPHYTKSRLKLERELKINRVFFPPSSAQRHLTKPLIRYQYEKTYKPLNQQSIDQINNWIRKTFQQFNFPKLGYDTRLLSLGDK